MANFFKFLSRTKDTELAGHLLDGERVIAWAEHAGGKIYVTNLGLLSFDHHENLRLPWELSLQGKWEEPVLTVIAQDEITGPPVTRAWRIQEPGLVPEAVRDRITSALVIDQVKQVQHVGNVRFIARKNRAGITWTTLTESTVNDAASQSHIALALSDLKESLGI